jgi:hypothetical protein
MTTDGWQSIRERLGRLLARGDQRTEMVVLETLDEDAGLVAQVGSTAAGTSQDVALQWAARIRDLLRSHPDAVDELRSFVAEISTVPATASDHSLSVGGDVHIEARGHAVAAGVIHGSVSTGNPPRPDSGRA